MPGLERNEMERLLLTLEARGELFPEFSLVHTQSAGQRRILCGI